MRDLGWERQHANAAQAQTPGQAGAANAPASAPTEQLPADVSHVPAQRANKERWRAVLPVPRHAPIPQRFRFGFKDKKAGAWVELDAVKTWEYVFEGQRYGYVARFERISSDGELVKDTVPLTWCEDTQDLHGAQRWHWKQWAAPRPLYVPASLLSGDLSLAVVVVEGEVRRSGPQAAGARVRLCQLAWWLQGLEHGRLGLVARPHGVPVARRRRQAPPAAGGRA